MIVCQQRFQKKKTKNQWVFDPSHRIQDALKLYVLHYVVQGNPLHLAERRSRYRPTENENTREEDRFQ